MTPKDILIKHPLFQNLDADILDNFVKNARLMTCDKGKLLFQQDESATHFYFIQSGWVKLFKQTLDGTEAIIDILNQHHIIGETAIFNDYEHTLNAEVIEHSTLIAIPLNILKNTIESTPEMALKMLKIMSSNRKKQEIELESRDIKNAPQRIGCFLLRLCPLTHTSDTITLHLPYDKLLIASKLGMKAETFSRALSKLKETLHIDIKGSTVIIPSIEAIKRYSCSVCSSVYPCDDL